MYSSSRRRPGPLLFAAGILIALTSTAFAEFEIRCGDTLRRTLEQPGRSDMLSFAARKGEVVAITVAADIDSDDKFDPRWELIDPTGKRVNMYDEGKRCLGQCETRPFEHDGIYRLRVSDRGKDGGGNYNVTLEAVSATADGRDNGPLTPACARVLFGHPDGTLPIIPLVLTPGVIDVRGETDTYTFTGRAGRVARINMTIVLGPPGFSPRWALFAPDGSRVRTADDGPACDDLCSTRPLPLNGTYTIKVYDQGHDGIGAYTLFLRGVDGEFPNDTTTTTTMLGATTTSTTASTTTSTTTTTTTVVPTTTTSTQPPQVPPPTFDLRLTLRRPRAPFSPAEQLGATLASAPGRLFIGAPGEESGTVASGAVRVLDMVGGPGDPTFAHVVATVRKPGSPGEDDRFGAAVVPTPTGGLLVGAPGDDIARPNGGAAYQFANPLDAAPRTFVQPGPMSDAEFGFAVADLDGRVVVSAPGASWAGIPRVGIAYLFNAEGIFEMFFAAPIADAEARFGHAIVVSDGDVIVGAPGGGLRLGRVFLFASDGDVLNELQSPFASADDEFGFALATDGTDVFVGAPGYANDTGAVFRFDLNTGNMVGDPLVGDGPGARFGAALAMTEAGLVIGAPGNDLVAGMVMVVELKNNSWGATSTLERTTMDRTDGFGTAVTGVGQYVVVGTPRDDTGTVDGGAVQVYAGGEVQAVLRRRLPLASFGAAVATSGADLVVGAPFDAEGRGAVHRFAGSSGAVQLSVGGTDGVAAQFGRALAGLGGAIVTGAPLEGGPAGSGVGAAYRIEADGALARFPHPAEPAAGDQFGFAVATVGNDVVVGEPQAGSAGFGVAYLLDGTSGARKATYRNPVPVAGDFFGAAVAGADQHVVVGAPFDGRAAPNGGAAYLFELASGTVLRSFESPTPADREMFGAAVAIAGGRVAIGVPAASGTGRVHVFDADTGGSLFTFENPAAPAAGDQFGAAVGILGDVLAVGAPLHDTTQVDTGAIYLFDLTTGGLLQTLGNPVQGRLDRFGAALGVGAPGLLVGAPGPSRAFLFHMAGASPARLSARRATIAPQGEGTTVAICGNGVVEGNEICDDGNDDDFDDCRKDCSGPFCCAINGVADPCNDINPCTDDRLDPVLGCMNDDNGSCCTEDSQCLSGKCRVCGGCALYPYDCCEQGAQCVLRSPECDQTACFGTAYCECAGGLQCADGAVPAAIGDTFASACEALSRQDQLAADPLEPNANQELLRSGRRNGKAARRMMRKSARITRRLAKRGEISKTCRKEVLSRIGEVKLAVPRGRKLRRCYLSTSTTD